MGIRTETVTFLISFYDKTKSPLFVSTQVWNLGVLIICEG